MRDMTLDAYWALPREDRRRVDDWIEENKLQKTRLFRFSEMPDGRVMIHKYICGLDGKFLLNEAGTAVQSERIVYDADKLSWPL